MDYHFKPNNKYDRIGYSMLQKKNELVILMVFVKEKVILVVRVRSK
jgi:hypothetical protein